MTQARRQPMLERQVTRYDRQTTAVVLGNARSGTSMVAAILQRLGVHMDATTGAPDAYAPKGYFESAEAHRINSKIFRLAWQGQVEFRLDPHLYPPPYDKILAQRDRVRTDIRKFVARFAERQLWGFKNPKTSVTFELYRPFLVRPHLIVTYRELQENAQALRRVYGLTTDRALKITMYYQTILAQTCRESGCPYLVVDFESARQDPTQAGADIAKFLGITMDQPMRDAVNEVVVPREAVTTGATSQGR